MDEGLAIVGENPLLLATRGLVSWYFVNFSIRPEERYIDERTGVQLEVRQFAAA
jgi:hypothetical protein